MGRPLNKRYFGNTNPPAYGTGGEGVASFTIGGTNNNYTALPTVTAIDAPTMTGGVQAVAGAIIMTAKSATVSTSGSGDTTKDYVVGDVLSVNGVVDATFAVASTKVRTVAVSSQGTGTWVTGDQFTFSTGFATPAVISITATAGVIDGFSIVNAGVRTATGQLTDPVTPDSTTNAGGVQGVSFNLGMGVNAVTVTAGGEFTAVTANPAATTTNSATGTGATLTVSYGISSIAVASSGSGYASVPAVTLSGGNATATAVLTVGRPNAITMVGRVVSGSTVSLDIIKQTGNRRYRVTDGTNTGIVTLVGDAVDAVGEANIIATDSADGTYYVTKLTAHRAVVTPGTGTQFSAGQSVPWTLGTATLNASVKIPNA